MDWKIILTSSAIASAIAIAMNFFITLYFKKKDFEYDYKKYILKRRQEVYQELEVVLSSMSEKVLYRDTEEYIHSFFLTEHDDDLHYRNNINKAIVSINSFDSRRIWLSITMSRILAELSQLLLEILVESKDDQKQTDFIKRGAKKFKDIDSFYIKLLVQYFIDIQQLDDIEQFKKAKG